MRFLKYHTTIHFMITKTNITENTNQRLISRLVRDEYTIRVRYNPMSEDMLKIKLYNLWLINWSIFQITNKTNCNTYNQVKIMRHKCITIIKHLYSRVTFHFAYIQKQLHQNRIHFKSTHWISNTLFVCICTLTTKIEFEQ